ncbi:MAG: molybdopterin-binding protein [Planctomycetota bacterium]
MSRHLAVLVIGNEVLSGKVDEANARFVIEQLKPQGGISKMEVVPDEKEAIKESVLRLSEQYSFVVTSGGVGPTHDDITVASIAEAFQTPRKLDQTFAQAIQDYFKYECTEALLSMALLPEGTEIIYPEKRAFPVFRFRNLFILPGIPEYFRSKFLAIKPLLLQPEVFLRQLYTVLDEGQFAHKLAELEQKYPSLRVGSYPKLHKNYQVMVTFESIHLQIVEQAVSEMTVWFPPQTLIFNPS